MVLRSLMASSAIEFILLFSPKIGLRKRINLPISHSVPNKIDKAPFSCSVEQDEMRSFLNWNLVTFFS